METNLKMVLKFHLLISLLCFPVCLVCLSVYLVVVHNIVCALTVQNDGRCISRIICSHEFYIYIYIHEDFVFSADSSMYHSLGYGTILYIQAVMTFDMVSMFCILCE